MISPMPTEEKAHSEVDRCDDGCDGSKRLGAVASASACNKERQARGDTPRPSATARNAPTRREAPATVTLVNDVSAMNLAEIRAQRTGA